jgi:hypothetical protein
MTRQQDLRTQLNSVREELMHMKRFIANLKFSSDADAARLLTRLRMGYDIARFVSMEVTRPNE